MSILPLKLKIKHEEWGYKLDSRAGVSREKHRAVYHCTSHHSSISRGECNAQDSTRLPSGWHSLVWWVGFPVPRAFVFPSSSTFKEARHIWRAWLLLDLPKYPEERNQWSWKPHHMYSEVFLCRSWPWWHELRKKTWSLWMMLNGSERTKKTNILLVPASQPTFEANFFSSHFSANSFLSDSKAPDPPTLPLTRLTLHPQSLSLLIKFCSELFFLKDKQGFRPWLAFLPDFWKSLLINWHRFFVVTFASILDSCIYPSLGSPHLFSLLLLLSLWAILKAFKTLLNFQVHQTSSIIFFFQITSIASVRQDVTGDLLTHAWSSSLWTLKNHSSSLLTSLRHLTRVWHKALLAKLLPYSFAPAFCRLIF